MEDFGYFNIIITYFNGREQDLFNLKYDHIVELEEILLDIVNVSEEDAEFVCKVSMCFTGEDSNRPQFHIDEPVIWPGPQSYYLWLENL